MSPSFARALPIIALVAAQDHTGKEGFLVEITGNTQASICNNVGDLPYGVILEGAKAGEESSIGVLGALPSTVRVKLGAPIVNLGVDLELRADGTVGPDDGVGARIIVGRPCELGATDELIEAVLFNPVAKA